MIQMVSMTVNSSFVLRKLYADLKVPMDPTIGSLEDIFRRIKRAHQEMVMCKFDAAAQAVFIKAHDELCRRKNAIPDDEDRRGILQLSKARGQPARMAIFLGASS